MKKIFGSLVYSLMVLSMSVSTLLAQSGLSEDSYRRQVKTLMEDFKNAKTDEQRNDIHGQVRQVREQYRAANPPKELPPAEIAARRQKMEEMLKKDPFRWEVYQLRQSMSNGKTKEERQGYAARIKALTVKHAAEVEARLTPEQRAAAQARKEKNAQMQVELVPLRAQLRTAQTDAARKAVRAQMQEILEKFR